MRNNQKTSFPWVELKFVCSVAFDISLCLLKINRKETPIKVGMKRNDIDFQAVSILGKLFLHIV